MDLQSVAEQAGRDLEGASAQDVLRWADVPEPEAHAGTLRLRVDAVALNFPDVLLCRGLYQEKPPLPFDLQEVQKLCSKRLGLTGTESLRHAFFALADRAKGSTFPRAVVPDIELRSPKITRKLTTAWFVSRVQQRHDRCLQRAPR